MTRLRRRSPVLGAAVGGPLAGERIAGPVRSRLTAFAIVAIFGIASVVAASTYLHASNNPQPEANLLASESDAVTSLGDEFQTLVNNANDIADHFFTYFFPSLQQELVNRIGLIEGVFEDPAKIFTLVSDFANLVLTGADAHFGPFFPPGGDESWLYGSLNDAHEDLYQSYSDTLGDDSAMQSSLDFLASPMSGILFGIFTPAIGGVLQFVDDITDAIKSFASLDFVRAIQDLLFDPFNIVNASLNGYGNVDVSIPASDLVPGADPDDTITSINLGGLFSPGGSLFNSLGIDGDDSDVSGEGFGEYGSLVSLQEGIAVALGWSGDGNPIDALGDLGGLG
jgi:hypothetical protein